jgi:hypothetical protein
MKRKELLKEAKDKGVWRISRLSRKEIVMKLYTHYLYYDSDRFKDIDCVDDIDDDFKGPEFMIVESNNDPNKPKPEIDFEDIKRHSKTPKYSVSKTVIANMNKPNPVNFKISFD